MLYFHAEATSPCVDAAGGHGDLISGALEILSVESSRVNVRQNGAFGHPGTARDFGGFEVLLHRRKGEGDIDQLGARFSNQRPIDVFSTFPGRIHSVRNSKCDQLWLANRTV